MTRCRAMVDARRLMSRSDEAGDDREKRDEQHRRGGKQHRQRGFGPLAPRRLNFGHGISRLLKERGRTIGRRHQALPKGRGAMPKYRASNEGLVNESLQQPRYGAGKSSDVLPVNL